MKNKVALVLMSATLVFVGTAWMSRPKANKLFTSSIQELSPITVNIKQLPVDNSTNILPVEILNPIALSNGKNKLERFSCFIKNNIDKGLNATALAVTILYEEGGAERQITNLLTSDSLVHPDMREERGMKDLESGFNYKVQLPGPITFKESVQIKSISIEIRCALFADDTAIGNNQKEEAAAKIKHVREGASKYKEWLKKQLSGRKVLANNIVKVIDHVNSQALPENVQNNKDFEEGADMYRSWLLKVYDTKGSDVVAAYLNKK